MVISIGAYCKLSTRFRRLGYTFVRQRDLFESLQYAPIL